MRGLDLVRLFTCWAVPSVLQGSLLGHRLASFGDEAASENFPPLVSGPDGRQRVYALPPSPGQKYSRPVEGICESGWEERGYFRGLSIQTSWVRIPGCDLPATY